MTKRAQAGEDPAAQMKFSSSCTSSLGPARCDTVLRKLPLAGAKQLELDAVNAGQAPTDAKRLVGVISLIGGCRGTPSRSSSQSSSKSKVCKCERAPSSPRVSTGKCPRRDILWELMYTGLERTE